MTSDGTPRRVYLFSGHIVDAPDRAEERFPAVNEPSAAAAIARALDRWSAGPLDIALCGGAAGSDLLFAEACLARDVPLEILMPFPQQRFLELSVDPSGADWRHRFERIVGSPKVAVRSAVEIPAAFSEAPFAYANFMLLERALGWGAERLRVLALWDGRPGDGAGGTADMVAAALEHTGELRVIDPAELG